MKLYDRIVDVVKSQLFMEMPGEHETIFRERLFMTNVGRFTAQGLVVVLMDTISLLFYLLMYRTNGVYIHSHILVHLIKITSMAMLGIYCSYKADRGFDPSRLLDKNINLVYPLVHFVLELALFLSGPEGLGALMRLLAVPFIVASIPIISQTKAFLMQVFVYFTLYFTLLQITPYGAFAQRYSFFVNVWVVVFACAVLVAFTVYSWFVNNFISSTEESAAKEKLAGLNEQLDFSSKHDPLTGLNNRRGFQLFLDKSWGRYDKETANLSIVMIDIDHFKRYNDRFGHVEGDECLRKVTSAIEKELFVNDFLLARYGGEEFIAVAYNQKHDDIVEMANRMRKRVMDLKLEHPDSDVSLYVTVSLGIATQVMAAVDNYDTLIDWADECLYFAKRSGRNRVIHTCYRQGDYRDVYGVRLSSGEELADLEKEFAAESTQRVIRDIGANSSFVYDERGKKLQFTNAAVELFDLPSNIRVTGLDKLAESMSIVPEDRQGFVHVIKKCIANRERVFSVETYIVRQHAQSSVPVSISGQCSYSEDGQLELVFGAIISVAKMVEYNHFLMQQSMTNAVTLLPNRNRLNADIRVALTSHDSRGYIVFLDIKDFKGINSFYSHSIGDKVLREVAHQLVKVAADYTPVYNYDVDQFVIVAQDATREETIRLMEMIYQHFGALENLVEGLELRVEFSIVAVGYAYNQTNIDQLFLDLDAATQMVKYKEKASYAIFDGEEKEAFIARINLHNALKKAVENGLEGFNLFYQPIVDAYTKKCVGAEALLRWKNAAGEVIPPNLVIPILEQSELMAPVEDWIVDTACRQCREWIDDGAGDDFFVNINVTAAKVGRATTYDDIMNAINANGLSVHNVTLEVTESSAMAGRKNAIGTLESLREQGVRIAIDDFGTGYSSLSYLHTLPASEIKIDRSFVREIDTNESARDFLDSIVSMAKSMGFQVCIEGIEKDTQSAMLVKARIDYLQGFLFGRPTPPDQFYEEFVTAPEINITEWLTDDKY